MVKRKNWWELDQHDQGIEAVLADKRGGVVAPPLVNPISPNPVMTPGSNPRVTPTHPNAEIRTSPDGSAEALIENRRGNTFTTEKVAPALTPDAGAQVPGAQVPGTQVPGTQMPGAPPFPAPGPEYDAARQKYTAEMQRGPQKQGAASQILFQIAEGMANFGRGMQGQQMKDFQWLGEAKDERRNAQAARAFAPHEALRQQQVQGHMQQQQIAQMQIEAKQKQQKLDTDQKLAERDLNKVDYEYYEAEGKRFSKPKGAPDTEWKEVPALRDRTKEVIERELADGSGTKFATTGNDEANRIATKSKTDAEYALKVGEINQRELDEHTKRLEAWQKENQGVTEKKGQLLGEAQTHETDATAKREQGEAKKKRADQLQEENPNLAAELRDQADKLEVEARNHDSKAQAARRSADTVKTTPPPKFNKKTVTAPKVNTGTKVPSKTVSQAQLEALSKKTGKSVAELKKMAEAEEYSFK